MNFEFYKYAYLRISSIIANQQQSHLVVKLECWSLDRFVLFFQFFLPYLHFVSNNWMLINKLILLNLADDVQKCEMSDEKCLLESANFVLKNYYGGDSSQLLLT